MGTANVYCGNTLKAKVNNYATSNHWHVARTVKCSSTTANNLLRIVATGLKGSTSGKGTTVVVDAVKVGTTLTSNPTLAYRWGTYASTLASAGRYAVADASGEAFGLTFRGTSITWRTMLGKNMGKAKVYVDGVYKGTFDQFATTTKAYNRTWQLTDTVHTIRVVATGTRRTGATGTRVVLDALTVG
jgi:bacillopeptidase F